MRHEIAEASTVRKVVTELENYFCLHSVRRGKIKITVYCVSQYFLEIGARQGFFRRLSWENQKFTGLIHMTSLYFMYLNGTEMALEKNC